MEALGRSMERAIARDEKECKGYKFILRSLQKDMSARGCMAIQTICTALFGLRTYHSVADSYLFLLYIIKVWVVRREVRAVFP